MFELCFIGVGKMGSALLEGYLKQGLSGSNICVYDKFVSAGKAFEKYGVSIAERAEDAVKNSKIIFLCTKPQDLPQLLEEISENTSGKILVSIAAGIKTMTIRSYCPDAGAIVRAMPNTPAVIGLGASAIALGDCPKDAENTVLAVFSGVGEAFLIEEEQMDAVTALSGSGPAYFYHIAETLACATKKLGLEYELAIALCTQTMAGAAAMLKNSEKTPKELVSDVASPGGTTEAALAAFDDAKLDEALEKGVFAAYRRGKELGSS